MIRISSIILFCIILSGCTTTVHLRSPQDVNRSIHDSSAKLNTKSGITYYAQGIEVSNDTTRFIDQTDNIPLCIQTQDIVSIQLTHHFPGAIEGVLWGSLGGLATGLVLGIVMAPGSDSDSGMGRGLLALGAMVFGGAGGFLFGLASGHSYVYVLPKDSLKVEGLDLSPLQKK